MDYGFLFGWFFVFGEYVFLAKIRSTHILDFRSILVSFEVDGNAFAFEFRLKAFSKLVD